MECQRNKQKKRSARSRFVGERPQTPTSSSSDVGSGEAEVRTDPKFLSQEAKWLMVLCKEMDRMEERLILRGKEGRWATQWLSLGTKFSISVGITGKWWLKNLDWKKKSTRVKGEKIRWRRQTLKNAPECCRQAAEANPGKGANNKSNGSNLQIFSDSLSDCRALFSNKISAEAQNIK